MTNSEHVARLKKGVAEWKRWREDHPAILPDLSWANLRAANLVEAVFSRTVFDNTTLADTCLKDVEGLDECYHHGPSTVDHRTLTRSGRLPLVFLRGCGLPDKLIEYLPSLLEEAIQFYSCFISYSTKDQDFADRLYSDLQNKGVRCWFAPHHVQGGKKIHEQIDEAISGLRPAAIGSFRTQHE
jgi:hypothetical protein